MNVEKGELVKSKSLTTNAYRGYPPNESEFETDSGRPLLNALNAT